MTLIPSIQRADNALFFLGIAAAVVFVHNSEPPIFTSVIRQIVVEIQQGFCKLGQLEAAALGQLNIRCIAALIQQLSDSGRCIQPGQHLCAPVVFRTVATGNMDAILGGKGRKLAALGFNAVSPAKGFLEKLFNEIWATVLAKFRGDLHARFAVVAAEDQQEVYILLGDRESGGRFLCALRFRDCLDLLCL